MSKIEEALKKARSLQTLQPQAVIENEAPPAADEIARMQEPRVRQNAELAARRIIYPRMRDRRVLNAFRSLRTTLVQRSPGRNPVTLVTATAPRGGASFVALNLAAAIALDENKTALVVDCHLRRPACTHLVMGEDRTGLTDFLLDSEVSVEQIIHPIGLPRVRVIPAGSHGDAQVEYFTLLKLRQLFRELRQRYRERYILVDAPSLAEAADVRLLAELCDQVLLVVPYGGSTEEEIDHAVRAFGDQKILGAMINNEPQTGLLRA